MLTCQLGSGRQGRQEELAAVTLQWRAGKDPKAATRHMGQTHEELVAATLPVHWTGTHKEHNAVTMAVSGTTAGEEHKATTQHFCLIALDIS